MSPGSVSLTMVVQPAYQLGSSAALCLIQRLRYLGPRARQEIVLAHRLQRGDSSQPRHDGSAAQSRDERHGAFPVSASGPVGASDVEKAPAAARKRREEVSVSG